MMAVNSIPHIRLALKSNRVTSEQLDTIRTIVREHFAYDAPVTAHSLPHGLSTARVEFATHADVALATVFNVFGEWNTI